jgi:hypothetical protein
MVCMGHSILRRGHSSVSVQHSAPCVQQSTQYVQHHTLQHVHTLYGVSQHRQVAIMNMTPPQGIGAVSLISDGMASIP